MVPPEASKKDFIELFITFVDPKGEKDDSGKEVILEGIPPVRINFLKS